MQASEARNNCGTYHSSILDDKDFQRDIQLHLTEIAKKEYIHAQDIVDYMATPEVQQKLGTKACGIHVQTTRRWLHKLSCVTTSISLDFTVVTEDSQC